MGDTIDEGGDMSWLARLLRNRWFRGASALGVILGLVGFVLSLPPVADMAFGKRVSLTLDVVSQIPVFAVRQPVPGLSVQLNSQDLTQTKRDLVAVRLLLRNDGEVSINGRNTTNNDPLGFSVAGGSVVRLYGMSATSEHLRKLAVPRKNQDTFVLPASLIIDPGDYIRFDLLIVRPVNGALKFRGLGKVEGLRSIKLGRNDMIRSAPSALAVAWSGGIVPQILRTLTYPFVAIAILAGVIAAGFQVSAILAKQKRRKRLANIRKVIDRWEIADPKLRKLVPTMYAAMGLGRVTELTDVDAHARRASEAKRRRRSYSRLPPTPLSDFEAGQAIEDYFSDNEVSTWNAVMILQRLSLCDEKSGSIDPALSDAINKFASLLNEEVPTTKLKKSEPAKEDDDEIYVRMDRFGDAEEQTGRPVK